MGIVDRFRYTKDGRYRSLSNYQSAIVDNWFTYALLLPLLGYFIFLLWIPFLQGAWMSLHSWPFLGEPTWAGLKNYEYLLTWEAFYTSLRATTIYALAILPQVLIALVAALIVANIDQFKNVISGIFLISYTMPPVVIGTLWLFLLNPSTGPIFAWLTNNGFLQSPIYWTTQGDLALTVITLVTVWSYWPFMFIIIYASRENIPEEYYETARVYGATRWQIFRHVTLPQLKSAILIALSIRLIWNLSKISMPLQLTGGGPGYETSLLAILLYNLAYLDGRMGLAYAIGILLLILSLIFVVVFIREYERSQGGRA